MACQVIVGRERVVACTEEACVDRGLRCTARREKTVSDSTSSKRHASATTSADKQPRLRRPKGCAGRRARVGARKAQLAFIFTPLPHSSGRARWVGVGRKPANATHGYKQVYRSRLWHAGAAKRPPTRPGRGRGVSRTAQLLWKGDATRPARVFGMHSNVRTRFLNKTTVCDRVCEALFPRPGHHVRARVWPWAGVGVDVDCPRFASQSRSGFCVGVMLCAEPHRHRG